MLVRRFFLASILSAGFAAAAHAQCDTRFTLVNNSGETVQEFYFGSSSLSDSHPLADIAHYPHGNLRSVQP